MPQKIYIEHAEKAVDTDKRFKHVMAITLNPRSSYKEGIIRCITNRVGDVKTKGFVDKSELYKVGGNSLEHFDIGNRLTIENELTIINQL